MKLFCVTVLLTALQLTAASLLDLSNAGIPLETGGKGTVVSDEKGKALHTSKIWQKSPRLHRKIHRGHQAYKYSSITNTPDGVKLVTGKEFASVTFPDGIKSNFSTRFFYRMKLKPEYIGKNLSVTFKVRGKFYSVPTSNYLYGGIVYRKEKALELAGRLSKRGMPRGTGDITFAAPVPKGAVYADLQLALYGCGELEFQQAVISVSGAGNAMSPDVIVSTSGYTDRKFYLPYKESFPVKFAFRREFSYKPKSVKLFVELPKGFTCTGYGLEMKQLKSQNGVLVFNALYPFTRTTVRNTFCNWRHNAVLIRADIAPSDKFYTMRYWMEADGTASKPRTLQLKVVPFEKHTAPKVLKSGLHYPSFNGTRFDDAGSKSFVEMYKNCGFNLISARVFPELSPWLRQAKIERIGNAMPMRNGYLVYAVIPPEQSFIDISGKPLYRVFCPTAVYERKSAYLKNVVEFTRKHLGPGGLYDHAGGNWEPYMYDYRGCFCKNCCGEFARYLKKEVKEIEKIWPKEVMKHYRKEWISFRSWQHGKVILTVNEDVKKAGLADGGKKSHFIPAISFYGFISAQADNYTAQYHSRDYAHGLERICIWGPYAHKASMHGRYSYVPAQHLPHLLACARVNEFLRKRSKATIQGLPQGSHVDWVTTPEAVVFETLSGFVHGHSMSTPYWFAYDYRGYREMARMNSLLAKIEPFLLRGEQSKAVKGTPVTPFLEVRHWKSVFAGTSHETNLPEIMSSSALQLRRFDCKGKIFIAAANVWEKSGVFFKLQLPDMKGNAPFVITDVESGKSLKVTADALRTGVELYVKELHWGFFLVEPFDKNKKYAFITAQEMAELKKKLLPGIQSARDGEDKLLSQSGGAPLASFDFGASPEIRSGELLCRQVKGAARGEVEIIAPGYRIEIDPFNNGRISSWKAHGVELVPPNENFGFGLAGCWMPHRRHLRGQFTLTAIKTVGSKLQVELTRPASRHSAFEVKSRYLFDTAGFRQEAEVFNRGKMASDMMIRFHTFSSMIAGGTITAGKNPIPVLPHVVFFRHGRELPNAELPLRAEKSFAFPVDRCTVTKKGIPFKLVFKAENLYGVLMWSNPGQTVASFEPTFAPVQRVQPGKSVKAAQSWSVEK